MNVDVAAWDGVFAAPEMPGAGAPASGLRPGEALQLKGFPQRVQSYVLAAS